MKFVGAQKKVGGAVCLPASLGMPRPALQVPVSLPCRGRFAVLVIKKVERRALVYVLLH